MAKHAQRTKIIVDGIDISDKVHRVNLTREPDYPDVVEITLFPDVLDIEDGTLIIAINTQED